MKKHRKDIPSGTKVLVDLFAGGRVAYPGDNGKRVGQATGIIVQESHRGSYFFAFSEEEYERTKLWGWPIWDAQRSEYGIPDEYKYGVYSVPDKFALAPKQKAQAMSKSKKPVRMKVKDIALGTKVIVGVDGYHRARSLADVADLRGRATLVLKRDEYGSPMVVGKTSDQISGWKIYPGRKDHRKCYGVNESDDVDFGWYLNEETELEIAPIETDVPATKSPAGFFLACIGAGAALSSLSATTKQQVATKQPGTVSR